MSSFGGMRSNCCAADDQKPPRASLHRAAQTIADPEPPSQPHALRGAARRGARSGGPGARAQTKRNKSETEARGALDRIEHDAVVEKAMREDAVQPAPTARRGERAVCTGAQGRPRGMVG